MVHVIFKQPILEHDSSRTGSVVLLLFFMLKQCFINQDEMKKIFERFLETLSYFNIEQEVCMRYVYLKVNFTSHILDKVRMIYLQT